MSRYSFVKTFNPGYDILVLRHFQQGGLPLDQGLSFDWAVQMKRDYSKKAQGPAIESEFCEYVSLWEAQPHHRPTQRLVIERIFGGGKQLGISEMTSLQSKLRTGEGKLVLTAEDVASEISDFYSDLLLPLLRDDLTRDTPALVKYIEPFDEDRLPDGRRVTAQEMDTARIRIAREIERFLETVNARNILENVGFVIEKHYNGSSHMKKPSYYHGKKDILTCDHVTQSVWLNCVASEPDYKVRVSLMPQRGAAVCEELQKVWLFPSYDVLASSQDDLLLK